MLSCPEPELIHSYWAELLVREIKGRTGKEVNLHPSASVPGFVRKNPPVGMLARLLEAVEPIT